MQWSDDSSTVQAATDLCLIARSSESPPSRANAGNFPLESLSAVLLSPLALDYLEEVPVRGNPRRYSFLILRELDHDTLF
jgi:hypothetical protein